MAKRQTSDINWDRCIVCGQRLGGLAQLVHQGRCFHRAQKTDRETLERPGRRKIESAKRRENDARMQFRQFSKTTIREAKEENR